MWRPIAPSVLIDKYSDYFEGNPNSKYFMNVSTLVKEQKRKNIVAVVHVNNTARPQVVTKEQNKYYGLLKAFYKMTAIRKTCQLAYVA